MQSLLDAYRANPSPMNALKLAEHAKKHPRIADALPMVEAVLIERALEQLKPFAKALESVAQGEAF
ncbi:hypothetical protein UFOVP120_32 [uncultured Caudovirales phage]|uniref:Uncharacterized protein n=1 Tax=uncultured Caudovirales phage TaxID=2100421 RepID=A0A6J5LC94_9CAUD|nr:hypothetical protein UFOVP120_32 [uncultured Caudovirales phage]